MLFGRKKEEDYYLETEDYLVIFDDEQKTGDIVKVTAITEDAVIAHGRYKVPYHDCVLTTGTEGRIFFYNAPTQSIKETKRLAELEKNYIIREIANYRYDEDKPFDFNKIALLGVTLISVLMLGISSCSAS